jgi:hypothetical protein
MESKRNGEKSGNTESPENEKSLKPAPKELTKAEPSTGYYISVESLQKMASIIDEIPTRYGVHLLKVLQEELRKV